MKILVVGGAGYIGSHMVKILADQGHSVVTLDNFSTGYEDAILAGDLIKADLAEIDQIDKIFSENEFDSVMHFASYIQVGESVSEPSKYYRNNFSHTQNLLDVMVKYGVNNFIFSSTAAIFGEPDYVPIDESHTKNPANPYGRSKWMVEQLLQDYERAYGLRSISLRYFNAAGAHPDTILGERHEPETHLIPLILQAASGRRDDIKVFGSDFDTHDGTCVRDYIHIMDLCDAHILAMQKLTAGSGTTAYNLGNDNGFSVQEVIDVAKKVTGCDIKIIYTDRRDGDTERLIADSRLAKKELGWEPRCNDLSEIIHHAWLWEQKLCEM
jgi:UDP-glucose 4-epimerase